MFIICFWLLSLALGAWMQFGRTVITIVAVFVFIVLITFCLLTSLFSYIKIYLRLRHHQNQSQPNVNQAQPPNGGQIPLNIVRYEKTVSNIAWVQLGLISCYLPFSVYGMLALFGGITLPIIVPRFAVSFLYLYSSLNPILYCSVEDQRSERSSEGYNQAIKLLCISLDLTESRVRVPARLMRLRYNYKPIRKTEYTL